MSGDEEGSRCVGRGRLLGERRGDEKERREGNESQGEQHRARGTARSGRDRESCAVWYQSYARGMLARRFFSRERLVDAFGFGRRRAMGRRFGVEFEMPCEADRLAVGIGEASV